MAAYDLGQEEREGEGYHQGEFDDLSLPRIHGLEMAGRSIVVVLAPKGSRGSHVGTDPFNLRLKL